jgi:membrane protein implicated in regulation of membrane protease activity
MSWWAWVVGGAVLLGAEMFFVDAQFYLVFIGSAAIVVGFACGAIADVPGWAQWAGFALLAALSMVAFRRRVYERVRGRAPGYSSGPLGTVLELSQGLAPGEACQIEHGGTFWTVQNDGAAPLDKGARARVVQVDGLTLRVRAQD